MSFYTPRNGMAGTFRPCRGQRPHVRSVIPKPNAARTVALMARLFAQKRKKHRGQKARRETAVPGSRPPARVGRKSKRGEPVRIRQDASSVGCRVFRSYRFLAASRSAAASTSSPGLTPRATASFRIILRLGCFLPLSRLQMKECTTPTRSLNCSCVRFLSCLYARRTAPKASEFFCIAAITASYRSTQNLFCCYW